jgi:hypothetical protein
MSYIFWYLKSKAQNKIIKSLKNKLQSGELNISLIQFSAILSVSCKSLSSFEVQTHLN